MPFLPLTSYFLLLTSYFVGVRYLILRVAGVLAAVYLALCALVWRYHNRLAFPGPRTLLPEPEELHIADAERVAVTTSDGVTLHGWYLKPLPAPSAGRRVPGLIWFYGNMETVAAIAPVLRHFRPPMTAVLILDYRGYGENGASTTEPGLYQDAEAAWSYLKTRAEVEASRIAVYGRSLGSVPALYLATTKPVRGVVLDSPFTTARAMAARHYPFFPQFLMRLSLDNLARASSLKAPLLVFHGSQDRIAPMAMGRAIAEAGRGELVEIAGAGHNETYDEGGDGYRDKMWSFLERHLSLPPLRP